MGRARQTPRKQPDKFQAKTLPAHSMIPQKRKRETSKRYIWKQLTSFLLDPFRSRHDIFAIIFSKFCTPRKMTPKSQAK